jgi:hypothetical protein
MTKKLLEIRLLEPRMAICRLEPDADLPAWVQGVSFCTITRTDEELSIVCPQAAVPGSVFCDLGWRCLKIKGPMDLAEIGVLYALARPLAEAEISVFALSTFNTDYLLVKEKDLERAIRVLSQQGHNVEPTGSMGGP